MGPCRGDERCRIRTHSANFHLYRVSLCGGGLTHRALFKQNEVNRSSALSLPSRIKKKQPTSEGQAWRRERNFKAKATVAHLPFIPGELHMNWGRQRDGSVCRRGAAPAG